MSARRSLRCLVAGAVVTAVFVHGVPSRAEGFDLGSALETETTWSQRSDGVAFQVLVQSEYAGDGSEILVRWRVHGKAKEQILFEGVSGGVELLSTASNTVRVRFWGGRYDCEGSYVMMSWRWNLAEERLIELPPVKHNPWIGKKRHLRSLLATDKFDAAWAFADTMDATCDGGFTYETDELFELFATAVHRRAKALHRAGRKRAAAALVTRLLTTPPYRDWPSSEENAQWFTVDNHWLHASTEKPAELLIRIPVTAANVARVNDLAYFLVEGDEAMLALVLLEQVVHRAPERVVAWLNLADARWDRRDREPDEGAVEAYLRYIKGMTSQGRPSAIPLRAWQRAGLSPPMTPPKQRNR